MLITKNQKNEFQTDFNKFSKVGFHGTTLLATNQIEARGLLPVKVFDQAKHDEVLKLCEQYNLETCSYAQWLGMRSVSFGVEAKRAVLHMKSGNGGGQGLMNMIDVLTQLVERGDDAVKVYAQDMLKKIDTARQSQLVVYAVDLSNLGPPLVVQDAEVFQYYFNPTIPLPAISLIDPSRLIERLDLI